jgi:hypothetical protein
MRAQQGLWEDYSRLKFKESYYPLVQSCILGSKALDILRNSVSLVRRSREQPRETSSREGSGDLRINLSTSANCSHKGATGEKDDMNILQWLNIMISYEAGNAGWNKTLFVPSFVLQLPPPTLYVWFQRPSKCHH